MDAIMVAFNIIVSDYLSKYRPRRRMLYTALYPCIVNILHQVTKEWGRSFSL